LIGEEICSLSAAHDERFELGCRNALSFFQALQSEAGADLYPGQPENPEQQARAAIWARHFDTYVTDYLNANEMIRLWCSRNAGFMLSVNGFIRSWKNVRAPVRI